MARRKNENLEEEYIEVAENQTEDTRGFFEKNQMMVLAVAAGILLLVGLFLAYKYLYQGPREEKAMTQLYKAEQQFKQDSFARALENPGGGFDGFLDIIDNFGSTKAGNLASYYAGISYLNLGKYDAAVEYLNSFSPAGKVTPITKYGALGDAYSELGDFSNAIANYGKAANSSSNSFLTPYYLKKLGLLLDREGQKDKALNAFQRILKDFPQSNEASNIQTYIAKLS